MPHKDLEARKTCKRNWYRRKRVESHGFVMEKSLDRSIRARFAFYCCYAGDCIVWTGVTNNRGYGLFNNGQTMILAHRYAYEQVYGVVPEGLQLDHLCRNRTCVNPGHLEAVTPTVNTQRGFAARRFGSVHRKG